MADSIFSEKRPHYSWHSTFFELSETCLAAKSFGPKGLSHSTVEFLQMLICGLSELNTFFLSHSGFLRVRGIKVTLLFQSELFGPK